MGLHMRPPLVTVYIPTRNRRSLLERAIKSVLSQTWEDFELYVVDDGSTDDTKVYLECVSARDRRVTFVSKSEPGGAASARNWAIEHARGEFITGLDDDDWFKPNRLESLIGHHRRFERDDRRPFCGCFSNSIMITPDREFVTFDRRDHVTMNDLFRHNYIGNQIFCRRELMLSVGGFDIRLPAWQDLDLFIRLTHSYGEARLVEEPTYVSDIANDRLRISLQEQKVRDAYSILLSKYSSLSANQKRELFLQMFSGFYGIVPRIDDFRMFLSFEWNFHCVLRLGRMVCRNIIAKHVARLAGSV
jgi:glycosyltransferase involved in cell wall biosynthesis